jgi:hypothetical protein
VLGVLSFSNPFVVLVLVGAGSFHWSPPFIYYWWERLPNYFAIDSTRKFCLGFASPKDKWFVGDD